MAFGTLNSILSTAVSITYTCCYAIVLMLHNVWSVAEEAVLAALQLNRTTKVKQIIHLLYNVRQTAFLATHC